MHTTHCSCFGRESTACFRSLAGDSHSFDRIYSWAGSLIVHSNGGFEGNKDTVATAHGESSPGNSAWTRWKCQEDNSVQILGSCRLTSNFTTSDSSSLP